MTGGFGCAAECSLHKEMAPLVRSKIKSPPLIGLNNKGSDIIVNVLKMSVPNIHILRPPPSKSVHINNFINEKIVMKMIKRVKMCTESTFVSH